MASKEATVYIVDCGRTMGESAAGRSKSHLDWTLEYVWDRITTTVSTGRKTALVGVVGLRTDSTENELGSEQDYQHISVFQEVGQVLMPELHQLREKLIVSNTAIGDAISALVIAIQMIARTCRKLQYVRRIVLVTDARAPMQVDDVTQIVQKIKEDRIELVILGVDFDDSDYGVKEEDKDETKAANETALKAICDECDGTFGTLAQAVDELGTPRVKVTKPIPSFRGILTLGNPEEYETALSIAVERYPKVFLAKPPTASKFVIRGDMATQASSATMANGEGKVQDDGLAEVKNMRTYQVEDDSAPGGKKDVVLDELAKGYEYGRTAVHISESDRNVTTYETVPGLDVVGFVDKNQYDRSLEMDRTNCILPAKNDDKAAMGLSSLIHALYELDSFAIARLVAKEDKEPRMLLLAPHIEADLECLFDTELPFAEDVREYKFPPLDRVVTVSGKVLTLHRNLPSDRLQLAMSAYVDSMDLSRMRKDDDGQNSEYAAINDTYSPWLHRVNQIVKHRAVHPDREPPTPYEILTKFSEPPRELVQSAQRSLDQLIEAAEVKRVPPKARGKRYGRGKHGREPEKPLSELDIGALLAQDPKRKTKRIDSKNAIPEFKQIFANAENISDCRDACAQLQKIIFRWIEHSVGDSGYGRAVEAIRVMREEVLEVEEPDMYNDMLKELKQVLLDGKLGGERKELWWLLRVNKLRLITKEESAGTDVDEDQAKAFMTVSR